jgi:phospholipid/cholesterol/gamma-HCH transport system substrate-binding protein
METRARFVLIGLFTLLGFLGGLGFILWLAKVQLDRTYAQYDILFSTVAGLSQTGAVRYNGIDVGKVLFMALDRADPALVRVRIEIYASTPIRTDTIATLASQGVTGVSYIALEGGSAEAERLRPVPPAIVPVIQSEMSVVQDLMNSGPDLVAAATALINDVRTFTTPENRDTIAAILQDVERATGQIDALVTRAEATLDRADAALDAATKGLVTADGLMKEEFPAMSADVAAALASATEAMDAVRSVAQSDAPRLAAEVSTLIRDASGVIATFDALARKIGNDPGRFLLGTETPEYRRAE